MKRLFILASLLSFLLFTQIAAQEVAEQKGLKNTTAHYTFGSYEIILRHQLRTIPIKTQEEHDNRVGPMWCAAFLQILSNGIVIDRLDFPDIAPLGWKAGLFLPMKQESPRHFIVMKYGDYDCRTIIITDNGKINNLGGGSYRIFKHRYLITPRELPDISRGGGEFLVFDLLLNKVLMPVHWNDLCGNGIPDNAYNIGYIQKFYTNGPELFAGIVLVDKHWQVLEHTKYFYRIDFDARKLIEALFDNKFHQEYVIDQSNMDLNHQCECIKSEEKH